MDLTLAVLLQVFNNGCFYEVELGSRAVQSQAVQLSLPADVYS